MNLFYAIIKMWAFGNLAEGKTFLKFANHTFKKNKWRQLPGVREDCIFFFFFFEIKELPYGGNQVPLWKPGEDLLLAPVWSSGLYVLEKSFSLSDANYLKLASGS